MGASFGFACSTIACPGRRIARRFTQRDIAAGCVAIPVGRRDLVTGA